MFPQLIPYFQSQPVKRAYMFGSVARGEQTASSDIDILVELDYEQGADFYQFLTMQEQLTSLLHKASRFSQCQWPFAVHQALY